MQSEKNKIVMINTGVKLPILYRSFDLKPVLLKLYANQIVYSSILDPAQFGIKIEISIDNLERTTLEANAMTNSVKMGSNVLIIIKKVYSLSLYSLLKVVSRADVATKVNVIVIEVIQKMMLQENATNFRIYW